MQYNLFKTKDQAEGQFDSGIGASTLTIVLKTGEGAEFPTIYRGTTTSLGSSVLLNKTGIGASGIAVGDFIENITDGSHAVVLTVSTNSLTTTTLRGGSDNTWQSADTYAVGRFVATLTKRNATTGAITAREQVLIGNRSSDTLTVETGGRGYNGTTARTFDADDYVSVFVTSNLFDNLPKAVGELLEDMDNRYTKAQIDALLASKNTKDPVEVATTANITLSGTQTIDGVAVTAGQRVLVKDQSTASQNGVYVCAAGAWSRSTDMDASAEFNAALVPVKKGTSNADTLWVQTADDPTVGSTSISFSQIGSSLTKASQAEAQAGTEDTHYMTPAKTKDAIDALAIYRKKAFTLYESVTAPRPVAVIDDTGAKVRNLSGSFRNSTKTSWTSGTNNRMIGLDYAPSQSAVLFAHTDTAETGVVLKAATLSGDTLTFGSGVTHARSANVGAGVIWEATQGYAVVTSHHQSATGTQVQLYSVAGTTVATVAGLVTVNSNANYLAVAGSGYRGCAIGSSAVLVPYSDTTSSLIAFKKGTISAGTITFGAAVNLIASGVTTCMGVDMANGASANGDQLAVVSYKDASNSYLKVIAVETGTQIKNTITLASAAGSISGFVGVCAYDSDNDLFLVIGTESDAAATGYGSFFAWVVRIDKDGCIASASTKFGLTLSTNNSVAFDQISLKYSPADKAFFLLYPDNSNSSTGKMQSVAIKILPDKNGVKFSTMKNLTSYTSIATRTGMAYHSGLGRLVAAWHEGTSTPYYSIVDRLLDNEKFLGICTATGTAGQSKDVALRNGISTDHSSLTIGARYYLQNDGTIAETQTIYPVGTAISSTEIALD